MGVDGRPTLVDVAHAAGVSHQTVSRVLRGEHYVRTATRERVLTVVAQLGYRPNATARALVAGRTGTLGVLAPVSVVPGVARRVAAVELAAREHDLRVLLTTADLDVPESVRAGLDRIVDRGVDGVVVVVAHDAVRDALSLGAAPVPCVLLASEAVLGPDDGGSVGTDPGGGARLAVRHLLELGHRRVLHLAGPTGWIASAARRAAYHDELAAQGIEPLPVMEGDWSPQAGYEAGRRLLPERTFTAVFAAADQIAIGWLHACHELRVAVPEQVSLVGYDDQPESAHVWPPLTTVRTDEQSLGRRAVDLVVGSIAADDPPHSPVLVLRRSTGPAPRGPAASGLYRVAGTPSPTSHGSGFPRGERRLG